MTLNEPQVMLSPVDRESFRIAWRVLTQFNSGKTPDAEDVRLLKLSARSAEKRLRIDDLACAVMRRELSAEVA